MLSGINPHRESDLQEIRDLNYGKISENFGVKDMKSGCFS